MEFSFFGDWSVLANPVCMVSLSVLRVLVRTRFTPTPAIRSFEQDIFKIAEPKPSQAPGIA
jgi:hypothetical protein